VKIALSSSASITKPLFSYVKSTMQLVAFVAEMTCECGRLSFCPASSALNDDTSSLRDNSDRVSIERYTILNGS